MSYNEPDLHQRARNYSKEMGSTPKAMIISKEPGSDQKSPDPILKARICHRVQDLFILQRVQISSKEPGFAPKNQDLSQSAGSAYKSQNLPQRARVCSEEPGSALKNPDLTKGAQICPKEL